MEGKTPMDEKTFIRFRENDMDGIKDLTIDQKIKFEGEGKVIGVNRERWNDSKELVCEIEVSEVRVKDKDEKKTLKDKMWDKVIKG